MEIRILAGLSAVVLTFAVATGPAWSDDEIEVEEVAFTEEILNDPEAIRVGAEIWGDQCTHCHGAKAYPGKAPKLRPRRYQPEFVFHRVTAGFKGMPPWKDIYSLEERMAVVSYIMSRSFSP